MPKISHLDDAGKAQMVDISGKADTARQAEAEGWVEFTPETFAQIKDGQSAKGEIIAVARIAGLMGAKKTSDLIPLCHPLPISGMTLDISADFDRHAFKVTATVKTSGKTGVEMEALSAVSIACLTIYDMTKALDKAIRITGIELVGKSGGKSGLYQRP